MIITNVITSKNVNKLLMTFTEFSCKKTWEIRVITCFGFKYWIMKPVYYQDMREGDGVKIEKPYGERIFSKYPNYLNKSIAVIFQYKLRKIGCVYWPVIIVLFIKIFKTCGFLFFSLIKRISKEKNILNKCMASKFHLDLSSFYLF